MRSAVIGCIGTLLRTHGGQPSPRIPTHGRTVTPAMSKRPSSPAPDLPRRGTTTADDEPTGRLSHLEKRAAGRPGRRRAPSKRGAPPRRAQPQGTRVQTDAKRRERVDASATQPTRPRSPTADPTPLPPTTTSVSIGSPTCCGDRSGTSRRPLLVAKADRRERPPRSSSAQGPRAEPWRTPPSAPSGRAPGSRRRRAGRCAGERSCPLHRGPSALRLQ